MEVLGLVSPVQVFKVGMPYEGFKPLLQDLSSLPIVYHCTRGEGYDEIVSQPSPTCFDVGCVGVQLVFRFFSDEIIPYVTVYSLYPWEEVSSESPKVTILNWNLGVAKFLSSYLYHGLPLYL